MPSKQNVRIKTTTTTKRVRKTGGDTGYRQCNVCNGTGRVKVKK